MKKFLYTVFFLLSTCSFISAAKKDAPGTFSLNLPSIKFYNNASIEANISSITIDYQQIDNNKKSNNKSVTTDSHIPLPSKKGKVVDLKLSQLPISSKGKNLTFVGLTKIEIENNPLIFENPLSGLDTIYINHDGATWILDKKAIQQDADNKKRGKITRGKNAKDTGKQNKKTNTKSTNKKKTAKILAVGKKVQENMTQNNLGQSTQSPKPTISSTEK